MPVRRRPAEGPGIRFRPDRRDRVDELDLSHGGRGDEVELCFRAVSDKDLRKLLELDVRVRVRAGPESGAVELDGERRTRERAVDAEDLLRLQAERITDDQLAEPREPRVSHQCETPTRRTRLMNSVALPRFIVERIRIAMT